MSRAFAAPAAASARFRVRESMVKRIGKRTDGAKEMAEEKGDNRIGHETKRRRRPRAAVSYVKAFHTSPPQRVIHHHSALIPIEAASYASLVANSRPFHVEVTGSTHRCSNKDKDSWVRTYTFCSSFTSHYKYDYTLSCNVLKL